MSLPLLFLDVDEVLVLERPAEEWPLCKVGQERLPLCLDHGKWLKQLIPYVEPLWLSVWGLQANHVGHALGLPDIDAIKIAGVGWTSAMPTKLKVAESLAEERPIAWLDTDFSHTAKTWADQRAQPTILVEVAGRYGLRQRDVQAVIDGLQLPINLSA